MMVAVKEKLVFWTLLGILILVGVFWVVSPPRKVVVQQEVVLPEGPSRHPEVEMVKLDIAKLETIRPLADYKSILTRSLFFKFVPPPPEVAPGMEMEVEGVPVPKKREQFVYKGKVVIGEDVKVIIEEVESGEVYFVGKGDKVSDYKLFEVSEKEIVLLASDGREIKLRLKE